MTRDLHLGNQPSPKSQVFTNCGKGETQETPVKSAQRKLTRVPFTVSRLMEFCTRRELVNQTGHNEDEWPLVVLKELVDNAIDACEEAEIAPVISITVKGTSIVVKDNGPGIPAKTIDDVLDYSIRVSSREAYVSPTRGAQGNALKTILPMGYVLDEQHGEHASARPSSRRTALRITLPSPSITSSRNRKSSTRPSRHLSSRAPRSPSICRSTITILHFDAIADCEENFLELAESYAWLNPHLTLRVSWNGERKLNIKASNPTWKKWLPSWPTSAHWYDVSHFRRYMAAHIAHNGEITVREFVSEFLGLTGTAKQKQILTETGASHVSLHNFFGLHKANTANITKLLTALKRHSRVVQPAELGIIGKDHLFAMLEKAGGEPKTFTYQKRLGETDGLPRVVEVAFAIDERGLRGRGPSRKEITGVNWSPGINNPFRQLGRGGEGLDAILEQVRAGTSKPIIIVIHVACPRVAYTDRGKSAIVVEGEYNEQQED